jgi:uncharacterized protein (DUF1015 family)
MRVLPFRGLLPAPPYVDRIPSVPYDVVSTEEARAIVADEPDSFLRVVRAEVDLPADVDVHDERVYAQARVTLRAWVTEGRMVHDARPAYYVYRLEGAGHAQTGVLAASAVDDYVGDRIKKHEHTRPAKEDDRVRHIEIVGAQCGPVLLTHRAAPAIDSAVAAATATSDPVADLRAGDGVRHTLWRVDDPDTVSTWRSAFEALPCTYIADGHHRAASAARVARARRARHGAGPWDGFLTVLFPAGQMRVLEYNRLIRDTAGLDPAALIARIERAGFDVREDAAARRPGRPGTFGMVLGSDRWYALAPRSDAKIPQDPVGRLDVSVLTDRVLAPILGIEDPRTDPRIDFVGGIRGPEELERCSADGSHAVGFALHPTRIDDVLDVADAGRVMPPKSTWFEPKARSGLVVLDFEAPET